MPVQQSLLFLSSVRGTCFVCCVHKSAYERDGEMMVHIREIIDTSLLEEVVVESFSTKIICKVMNEILFYQKDVCDL